MRFEVEREFMGQFRVCHLCRIAPLEIQDSLDQGLPVHRGCLGRGGDDFRHDE